MHRSFETGLLALAMLVGPAGCDVERDVGGEGEGEGPQDSGLDPALSFGELGLDEQTVFCRWSIGLIEQDFVDCGDFDFRRVSLDECLADPRWDLASCSDLTIGEAEDCSRATAEDPCAAPFQAACAPMQCGESR